MRLLALLWIAFGCAVAAQESTRPQEPVVVTVGEAVVRRAPDRAFVTISVETRAKSPRDAQRQNAEAMTAVQQRLSQARLGSDAIRTTGYNIQQEFDFVQGKRVPREFVARNGLEVRVDEVARTGEILDAVVESGATSVSGVRFELKDRDTAEREALKLAVADARARAEAAVSGAGRSIDRVLRIEDSSDRSVASPRPMMMTMARSAESAAPTPVEPGLIEIRARVTLTASMK
jgi:uncharacterized protein YggE